jgi:CRISPR-associated endonuclease/helicase Cas3
MFQKILAKSPSGGREITLSEHAATVSGASECLFGSVNWPTRLGREWLRFFRLGLDQFPAFLINLQLAALFHDLGKANEGFQKSFRHRGEQAIRHEHLSALLLYLEPLRYWLARCGDAGVDVEIILSAIVSHHLKVNHDEFAKRLVEGNPYFSVFTSAPEFIECLQLASQILRVPPPDLSQHDRRWSFNEDVDPPKENFKRSMHSFKTAIRGNDVRHRLLVAVKAALIAADSVGSALVREQKSLEEWIGNCFGDDPLTPEWINQKVIQPRIREFEKRIGRAFHWHDFQAAAGELGERALLLSGCGTGKTLAAWNWIKTQLGRRPASRVLFLYPTRGTATEGFRDYVSWAGGEDAALLHGTAAYDLEGMFENPSDPRHGGDYHVQERLFALGYWPKRVFSATVDSLLAFMRNQYASLCLLPVLADSVVVVDEIHSFDRAMFTALERFLKFFDLPVLCMTASLTPDRLETLRDGCCLEVFPRTPVAFADLKNQSEAPRYQLSFIEEVQALALVQEAIGCGKKVKKVLWVVNAVRRCQEKARALAMVLPADAKLYCYHSRFRLSDRRTRHNEVIGRFQSTTGPIIVVTTQVCEMSLDLDADILITEIAPVTSIIQRMGRCCREPLPRHGRFGEIYVYQPRDAKPYEKRAIDEGKTFVETMRAQQRLLSHADLANYLAAMEVSDPFIEGSYTSFLDGGAYAMAREEHFREGDDFTVDCVLDADVNAYLARRKVGDPSAEGFIVPVPKRFTRENARLGRYLREAQATQYNSIFGFQEGTHAKS